MGCPQGLGREQSLVEGPAGVSSGHSSPQAGKASEALQSRKAEQRIGQAAKRAGEGPNGASPEWGGK